MANMQPVHKIMRHMTTATLDNCQTREMSAGIYWQPGMEYSTATNDSERRVQIEIHRAVQFTTLKEGSRMLS